MHVALPDSVKTVLEWWFPHVQDILGANRIRSILIGGGLALQDFSPGWSDVDTCVVLTTTPGEKEGAVLGALHADMADRFLRGNESKWKSHALMDAIYVPYEIASDATGTWRYYSVRETSGMFVERNVSGFARYIMHHFPLFYYGSDVRFAMPTRADLLHQLDALLERLMSPPPDRVDNAIWLADKVYAIARSVVFWRDGILMSKTAAMRHEIASDGPFSDAYRLGLCCRERDKAFAEEHLPDLSHHFQAAREPAAFLLRRLAYKET